MARIQLNETREAAKAEPKQPGPPKAMYSEWHNACTEDPDAVGMYQYLTGTDNMLRWKQFDGIGWNRLGTAINGAIVPMREAVQDGDRWRRVTQ